MTTKKITITSMCDESIPPMSIDLKYDKLEDPQEMHQIEMSEGWKVKRDRKQEVLQLMRRGSSDVAASLFEHNSESVDKTGWMMNVEAPHGLRVHRKLPEAEQQLAIAIIICAARSNIVPMCKIWTDDENEKKNDLRRM